MAAVGSVAASSAPGAGGAGAPGQGAGAGAGTGQQVQLRRLLSAYRVGMLALETQARRVHDDRPQNKFGRWEELYCLTLSSYK